MSNSIPREVDCFFRPFIHLIELKECYTACHCQTVSFLSKRWASAHFLPQMNTTYENVVLFVELGARIHDLGKIVWNDDLISGKYIDEKDPKKSKIKSHPIEGYDALNHALPLFSFPFEKLNKYYLYSLAMVLFHHWGHLDEYKKYPDPNSQEVRDFWALVQKENIEKEEIEFAIGTIKVADCLHAAISNRNYRNNAKTVNDVVEEFKGGKGTVYHPKVVDIVVKDQSYVESMIMGQQPQIIQNI